MPGDTTPLRVLLVEDNPADARLIEKRLLQVDGQELGMRHDLTHVERLSSALDALERDQFDVVLLDLGLPESTGIETAERVVERHPAVPVVVLTGLKNDEVAVEAIRIGAQDYLRKTHDLDGTMLARSIRYAIERNARERQLELRTERLEEFATVLSHELRNPLNIALGFTDMARETGGQADLDRIKRALDRMDLLVEKLLKMPDLAATEGFETVELATLVEECWANVDTREADLVVHDLSSATADRERLCVLFEHLFENAVQHGGSAVTVEVGTLEAGDGFYVADDGDGFPDGAYASVFDQNYSTGGAAAGFGLTIVRNIVEDHVWDVRAVESTSGGTRIEVSGLTSALSKLGPRAAGI